jgi:tetratricopeptide (TPR) repeat protein
LTPTLEDYLKGRYFWNKRTAAGLKKAVDYFNQAIARDPNYAVAYSGLADTYALLGDWQFAGMPTKEAVTKSKATALKALELDDTLGEAHNSLAFCLEGYDWNFVAADREIPASDRAQSRVCTRAPMVFLAPGPVRS